MANESQLRERWNALYRDSGEYQNALRSDAIARTSRAAQGRELALRAMANGDTGRAAAIRQQLSLDAIHARQGTDGGRAAGLDEFQNNRVSDYITQATARGRDTARSARSDPLSVVTNGPGYYASLENPDFATHFPYADIRDRSKYGRYGNYGSGRGALPPQSGGRGAAPVGPPLDPQIARMRATDAYNATLANTRKEQHLLSSLPKPLADAYRQKYLSQGGATPEERQDFLSRPPEYQWGRLRGDAAAASPRTPGTGSDTFGGGSSDFAGAGATKVIGSGGSIGMPTIQPLGTTRATAELNQPKDVLQGAGSRTNDGSFLDWNPDA